MKNKYKNGIVIPFVIVFGSVLALILTSLLGYVSYRYQQSVRQAARANALQAAEAGLNYYYWYVLHTLEGLSSAQLEAYWNGTPLGIPYYDGQLKNQAGTVIGDYRIAVTKPVRGSTIIMAEITGRDTKHPSIERRVRARLRKPSWSEYCVIANDVMRFGAGTETWGPIHSNNGIHFDGIAHNLVSSYVTTYWDPDYRTTKPGVWTALSDESQVFLAGKEFPAEYKDFNGVSVNFGVMKDYSQPSQGGLYFPDLGRSYCGYHLRLRIDGTIRVSRISSCNSTTHQIIRETTSTSYQMPSNGLIFFQDDVWVDGTISNVHLTVAAADPDSGTETNIYLNNDVTYTNFDGKDVLGLVAQNNVDVGLYSDNNLEVDAALVAQIGRVGRDYYSWSNSSTYYIRNTITVYGAIATNRRYGFAWVCGSTHCSGYRNRNLV
ncbi:MAG: hypothetical protein FJZ04_02800, partial [Candidatus Moranbacteria bacterium]|nr:hypothetical protein [Candidatus Moranbacteria bacterium]